MSVPAPAAPVSAPTPPGSKGPGRTGDGPLSRRNITETLVTGYVPLALTTLVVFLPLMWMVLSSFKGPGEIVTTDLDVLPDSLDFSNYQEAMTLVPFGRFFVNSVIVTLAGASIKVVLAILTAYALVFIRFPFKRAIFVAILVALMVPPQVAILPNYILVTSLGGADTYWGMILPGLGTAFGTFLLRQHFLTLPGTILESAEIDGAGHWSRLWRIVVPISVPTIATVGLVTIVTEWNEYIWPLVIVSRPEMMTLPVGLTLLRNSESDPASWGIMMAGAVLVLVPILVVFAALQRYIVAGLTQGSVTG
ncbi:MULTISPECIES: carbohydrate ABC transporter permease [unclassified Arthrobacter]|uniref:carbohydrate ABC transporter permease n=1 Tax=unclassified Arthrobacter TaxID=235627 RepID=UPI001D14EB51|nr:MULTISPECIES: carbohydrate ABC transporter permease [unclassified Arthrobacter]MCC3291513.1 carbohydrate ABC transporter permease [Arthrobacter sp. zg-Y1110]MCC3302360.1 carbohydrate ABC transporter permease [Arthrobacter sp. zg-Y895]UWX83923.1 carbohydrate ABC transporter permease [Arthrobacter sp. zg-Y1110]